MKLIHLALMLVICALSTTNTVAKEWSVPGDGTIQECIDASAAGDTILVRPDSVNGGPYHEAIDFKGKAITVRSEWGPDVTTIDETVWFHSGEGHDSILDGFMITNGTGIWWGNEFFLIGAGGGICCQYNSSPTITNNIICENHLSWRCSRYNNRQIDVSSYGGGILCASSSAVIANNIVRNNSAECGGGICCEDSNTTIVNNVLCDNDAQIGGGLLAYGSTSDVLLLNSTLYGNTALDDGGGVWNPVTIVNCILWGNFPDQLTDSGASVTYSDIQTDDDPWPGEGNINADPLLYDPGNGDFHSTRESPCIGAGSNSAEHLPLYDFEGDPRIAGPVVDMGADEFWYHLYHVGDVVPGGSISLRTVGTPGKPVLLALGAGIRELPWSTQYGNVWLMPPLSKWNLGTIPLNGILDKPVTVPAAWVSGSQHPLQALVGPKGNPNSRLTNLEVLVVE